MNRSFSPGAISVVLTLVSVILAGILIYRVAWTAEAINEHARSIDDVAITIEEAALAVTALGTTNELAQSILDTASPLDGQLTSIADLAESVDGLATTINGTAGTIRGTAATINSTAAGVTGTASGINDRAGEILDLAESIMRGVDQINANLDTTIDVVGRVEADTTNILGQAEDAHTNASCIDAALGNNDGDCNG